MARLHPTAIIDPAAELDSTVEVGPYSVIGPGVKIGAGTKVGSHVVLDGPMQIGCDNQIFPYAALGAISQDKTAKPDDPTSVVIGDGNVIREFVTIQRGTMKEFDTKRGVTAVGDRNWIMNYCHIAHDCQIGSDTIFANNSSLAGHVEIGDWVILGGYTLVYQFCRIGAHAFTAFSSGVAGDIPPFVMVQGNPAEPRAINKEGLRRRKFAAVDIEAVEEAYKLVYRSGKLMADVKTELVPLAQANAHVKTMLDFILSAKRPLVR
ncbi:acyl-[acyl-carrier-protein]--UDP-N-acetylglucosamine O-acyltransferase [Panacagrimonas perspica]|uniref:acyl-ACP--UDP-N-acetylglucosamine O-acyltransferase n=1 Tax=Panacagrimonas perspica TaxID=381431 RepID=UPI00105D7E1E|nr:acyl-[acyl-carrier-protein]--UDP-N-acetylglucosamine O-acyltransferase [Panacagrimonas perspica]